MLRHLPTMPLLFLMQIGNESVGIKIAPGESKTGVDEVGKTGVDETRVDETKIEVGETKIEVGDCRRESTCKVDTRKHGAGLGLVTIGIIIASMPTTASTTLTNVMCIIGLSPVLAKRKLYVFFRKSRSPCCLFHVVCATRPFHAGSNG